jgi:hypothetical protein
MKINARLLMDKYHHDPKGILQKEIDDDGYYSFWNVPVNDLGQSESKRKKATKEDILSMMLEEDPKAESQKMLRPLYLVFKPSKKP